MTAAVIAAAGAGLVATATSADASIPSGVHVPGQYYYVTPCAGHVIKTYNLRNEANDRRGVTKVYYSPANAGTVCVMTLDESRGKHGETVTLRKHSLGNQTGSDRGSYQHYAGGIAVPRSNGRCFTVTGSVSYGSGGYNQYSGSGHFCHK
ncbi:hypothetical protein [Jatrophihabitans endophyticus]|uniref:hypothetical protein n=1 Tax=Jatrophihabitans endophyticus TaxID=1206085 RepID=UPI0019D80429|nr:hypothetical protein [Jatrophihabitans endophyticus]MBE7188953.1 hypothetical protein [Jatrophihabitans endophyticus]